MPQRLPDEFFRDDSPAESDDVVPAAVAHPSVDDDGFLDLPLAPGSRGVAPRLVVAGVLGALLLGFGVGRIVALNQGVPDPSPSPSGGSQSSQSASPSPSVSPKPTLVPFDGPVATLAVSDADGRCQDGVTPNEPANLIDSNPNTIWRCAGAGAGEEIRFSVNPGDTIVGVRLVNGNTVWAERYLAERRILSVQWTFSDGSWVLQGLAASDRSAQEIRFPPVTGVEDVTMTILDVTVPGASDGESDAVSISSLDFLTVG